MAERWQQRLLPVATACALVLLGWYLLSAALNLPQVANLPGGADKPFADALRSAWSMERPLLPAPHQILAELSSGLFDQPVTSKRSLVFHSGVTLQSMLVGLVLGVALGLFLALAIVHVRMLDRAWMPWIVASQTVPILAIAPMIVVVFGNLGWTGLAPKAVIAGWLSFFPVVIGIARGLRAPDPLQLDLLRTYDAGRWRVFTDLRWPSAMQFLFPSLKIAVALATVGAVVAELPTGAEAGLGSRLLAGSYFGKPLQIWAALVMASLLAAGGIGAVTLAERATIHSRGGRR